MDTFTDRTAVITGAASGIGLALCRRYVAHGADVIAVDIDADQLEANCAPLGHRLTTALCDVADPDAMSALAHRVFTDRGAVHLLVNNAGVTARKSMLEATRRDWEFVLGVNVWGVVNGIESFVTRMVASGQPGHVVNTCSTAAFLAAGGHGIYCASKHEVAAISASLAEDLLAAGAPIGVTAVCPSAVNTNFHPTSRTDAQNPDDVVDAIESGIRDNRLFVFPDRSAVAPALDRMRSILEG